MVESLPYSQLLCVKIIVEDPMVAHNRLYEMCLKFSERAYPHKLINRHRKRIDAMDRQEYLRQMYIEGTTQGLFPLPTVVNTRLKERRLFVIYILKCPCALLYVGEMMTKCQISINKHKFTIRTGRLDVPVAKHFSENGHDINDLGL